MHPPCPRLTLISCLLAAGLVAGCGKKAVTAAAPAAGQRQPVEVVPIIRRDLAELLNVVGSLAANESATIRPEISGLVRAIAFDEGQQVQRGQLLAKIEDAELRAQVAQSEARFELAQLNLQRAENLQQTQANTKADMDRAQAEFATARADLDLLRVRLDRTEIKAPFDGVVDGRSISPGDYVNPQSVVTTIDDLSRLKVDFQVPERFAGKVGPGTPFTLKASAAEHEVRGNGEVYFRASVIDRATRSSQVKGHVLSAVAGLKPGMFVNIEVVLATRSGALTVPEGAILSTARGAQIVAVKDSGTDKTAEFVPVRTGLRAHGYVEITPLQGSLAEGREVVAAGLGALILFPGARLDPRPAIAEFKPAN